jgi:hypothetical protein
MMACEQFHTIAHCGRGSDAIVISEPKQVFQNLNFR